MALASMRIDGKSYFTVVSSNDIKKIIEEQHLQNSGLLDVATAVEVGKLLGGEAYVSGSVNVAEVTEKHYKEKRQKCADHKCKKIRTYSVSCMSKAFHLGVELKMVDTEKSNLIYDDTHNERWVWHTCSDSNYVLPSRSQGFNELALIIASKFTGKLMPYYFTFDIVLLDEADGDYSDEQEKMLENAIIYIEHKRYEKAEQLLSRLLDETQERSYVAAYNLGVVKEIKGELKEAKELYTLADKLALEPVAEIHEAMVRIKYSLKSTL